MRKAVDPDPNYNGSHSCPGCGAASYWICVKQSPVVVRVICDGVCGTFETAYSELQTFPFFDKPVHKLALR